jgi:PhnB protein
MATLFSRVILNGKRVHTGVDRRRAGEFHRHAPCLACDACLQHRCRRGARLALRWIPGSENNNQETVMDQPVRPVPAGFNTVTPHLVCAGAAAAIDFYRQAFSAVEVGRMPMPDGRIAHAELRIGDSRIMLADAFPEYGSVGPQALKGTPVYIHLYVEDADAAWAQALAAGATPVMPLADMFWGDRYGQVEDPFGHRWSIATHQRDLTIPQMQAAMAGMMPSAGAGAGQ